MAAATLQSFGYAFELAAGDLPRMIFWTRVQYVGIVSIPIFWLLLAARYTGRAKWLTKNIIGLMIIFSAVTLVLNYTNAWHHLYYTGLGVDSSGPFPVIVIGKGIWYWINQGYINLAVLLGNMILIAGLRRAGRTTYRQQTLLMILGSLFPWIAYGIYLLGLSPHNIDLTPFGMAMAGPVFALALFRYRLLDIVPVAREAVFTGMSDGVVVIDGLNRLVDFNPAAQRVFPELNDRRFGTPAADMLKDFPQVLDLIHSNEVSIAEIFVDRDGARRYFYVRMSPITSRRLKIIGRALLLNDANEQVLLREKLRALASVDELTGADNRRHFLDQGKKEINRAKRSGHALSVLIVDLDHFKSINDRWGHEAGDLALKEASSRIKNGLRAADVFGRHGGEEFAVLLPETPPEQAILVAERLREAISHPPIRLATGAPVALTASFGVAGVDPVREEALEDLIRAADRAMYQAKTAGRNCVRAAAGVTSAPL
jgi:diguanylate cyclase (GGDEF)-like protein